MPMFKRAPDNYRRQAFGRNPAVEQWRIRGARRLPGAMDQACGPPGSGSGHAEYRHHRPVDRTGGFLVMERVREGLVRSEEHTSELQSLMRRSYAVFCLKKKNK